MRQPMTAGGQTDRLRVAGCDGQTSLAFAIAWRAALPPLQKFVLLAYDNGSRTNRVADITGLHPFEVEAITGELCLGGLLEAAEFGPDPSPTGHASPSRRAISRAVRQCQHCGATDDLTIDHRYPVVLGGSNAESNLQVLCRTCNCRKGAQV